MRFDSLESGTKLELELFNDFGEVAQPTLVSEIEWYEGENTAFIAVPIHEGVFYPLHVGTLMNLYFLQNDNLYRVKVKIVSRYNQDNIPLLKVQTVSEIIKIQRRQFFRFSCLVHIGYREINDIDEEVTSDALYDNAITKDLSGSGLCMLVEKELVMNSLLDCKLQLDGDSFIQFIGRIMRVVPCEFESRYKYEIGLCFEVIENKDREAVIKYIFNEQRKLRKKGLI